MLLLRCGLADMKDGVEEEEDGPPLDHLELTFAFGKGTTDQVDYMPFAQRALDFVRHAFGEWASTGHFAFHEVGVGDNPDFHIAWSAPADPDYAFATYPRSVIGFADFPGPDTQHVRFND